MQSETDRLRKFGLEDRVCLICHSQADAYILRQTHTLALPNSSCRKHSGSCSTTHVLILVPVFFALMKERALRRGALKTREPRTEGE